MLGLSAMGADSPSAGVAVGVNGVRGVGLGGRRGAGSLPRLFELADELGGVGTSGLRWSELAMFDDQVCFFGSLGRGGRGVYCTLYKSLGVHDTKSCRHYIFLFVCCGREIYYSYTHCTVEVQCTMTR